ncbi:putative Beta tubulin [Candidatus Xenohaliotis californiensis]|uniref:Beta tubulin n=1 Tax=Candidatus Xenohaliotis californiensis TaxID=84677 RepID=A0ABM9N950_9RICK|nr:putative Beta tubulin [Candidatus Xenohaliotis californiensis]
MNDEISNKVSSIALCWKIARLDGTALYFTNHDNDIVHNGTMYIATISFNPSELSQSIKMDNGGFEIDGIIDSKLIKRHDLISGLYDGAEIHYLLIDTEDEFKPAVLVRHGYINAIKIIGETFVAEIEDVLSKSSNNICASYSMLCRASIGDALCKIDLTKISVSGTVERATSNRVFFDSRLIPDSGRYTAGKIIFTSGLNRGSTFTIKKHVYGEVALTTSPDFAITAGDQYNITPGCEKTIEACFFKFGNSINFRGEPYIPVNENGSRVVVK